MGHLKVDLVRMVLEYDGVEIPITNEQVVYPPDMTSLTVVPAVGGGGGGGGRTPRALLDQRHGYGVGGGGGQRPGDPDPSRIVYWNRE